MAVKLNASGEAHLRSLIESGDYNSSASWSFDAHDGNALLGAAGNDWSRYASVHLGEDDGAAKDTEGRWKYPAAKAKGKSETVYRAGLIAAKQRAAQQGVSAIANAAGRLIDLIDGKQKASASLTNRPRGVSCEISEQAMARWNPGVRAAADAGSDNNVISILDVIGQDFFGDGITARRVSAALRSIGNKDVVVEINSPGGDFFEGLAIYNTLREHPQNVTVKILGLAASAAAVIAMAGDTILMPRAGFLMIHNTWVMAMGDQNALREAADFLAPFDAVAADIFATRTGMDQKKISKMLDAETWIGGADAVDQGFADDLLPADAVDAKAKNEFSGAAHALRRLEAVLAKGERMPRSERRRLIKELSGTPRAADDGTPSAAEPAVDDSDLTRLHLELARLKRLRS